MIDCSELLLAPWPGGGRSACRKVFYGSKGAIGSIHRSLPRLAWALRPRFEIREGDDESLLFSVSPRSWMPRRWLVHDADDQLMGTLIGRQASIQALSQFGLPVAEVTWLAEISGAKAVSPRGAWLCDIARHATGTHITFAAQTDPFSRMVLLAAALVAEL